MKHVSLAILFIFLLYFFFVPVQALAYYTNMPASVVVGQTDFMSSGGGTGQSKVGPSNTMRGILVDARERLIVSDQVNHRVLIWNSVPQTNGVPADLVLGQANFTNNTLNEGGLSSSTLNAPGGIFSDGTRLFVADSGNNRVLIWNSLPTTMRQPADIVVGQSDMTTNVTTCDSSHLVGNPQGILVYNGKLLISAGTNPATPNRVLIWNSIPTANGASADIVLGQTSFSTCGVTTISASTFSRPQAMTVDEHGRLYLADVLNSRVLVWNSIPTSNNVPADIVIGKPDFTTSTGQTTDVGMKNPQGIWISNSRLFVVEPSNNRALIFNSLPNANSAKADIVLGQTTFTNNGLNQDGSVNANTLSGPLAIYVYKNQLFIGDQTNNRILIYNNSLPNNIMTRIVSGLPNGQFRFQGSSKTTITNEIIKRIEYSVNGGTWIGSSAKDGTFDSANEDFYFDFNPDTNTMADNQGYTVKIRATHDNEKDTGTNTLYFEPFKSISPENNMFTQNRLPFFSYTIQKVRFIDLKENLDHFRVMISTDNRNWIPYIDNIPVDYNSVRLKSDNLRPNPVETMNGVFEDKFKIVTYEHNNSVITVAPKSVDSQGMLSEKYFGKGGTILDNNTYYWRVEAQDHAEQIQYTDSKTLRIGTRQVLTTRSYFPLVITGIGGINGTVFLSTDKQNTTQPSFSVNTQWPTLAGIATSGSKVTLMLKDTSCAALIESLCIKTYDAFPKEDSTFRKTIPKALKVGGTYEMVASVRDSGDNYNELPPILITVASSSATQTQ